MKVSIKFEPHKVQKKIIELFEEEDTRILSVACGRRLGKSYVSQYLMLKYGLTNNNKRILYITPTYRLATLFYDEISKRLQKTNLIKSSSKGNLSIELFNGTEIEFFSGTQPDNIRGRKYNFGVIDEGAYMTEYCIKECVMPCFSTDNKSKIIICSTPRGACGSFYDFYNSTDEGFKHIHAPSTDSPYVDTIFLNAMKNSLSARAYQQEILAMFLKPGDGGIFKNVINCINQNPKSTPTYYAGLDIGFSDSTVLTILNAEKEMVKQIEWEEIPFNDLIPIITKELKQFNISRCLVEKNGIGKPVLDYLKVDNKCVVEWVTTNESKNDIIEALMLAFEQSKIKILSNDVLLNQLDCYAAQQTRTGKTTFNGVGAKDDRVMSLALALKAVDSAGYSYKKVSLSDKHNRRK